MVSGIWIGDNATEGPACFRINVPGRSILGDLLLKRHSLPSFNISSERYSPFCCEENLTALRRFVKKAFRFLQFLSMAIFHVRRMGENGSD